jgi:DNA primase
VHGNAIGFLIEQHGMGFVDAVRDLAQQAGLTVPETASTPGEREEAARLKQKQLTLSDVLARAAEGYRRNLKTSERAIAYLKGRGLSGEIAVRFGLGYAADSWRGLASIFASYDDPLLEESGLVIFHADEPSPGDDADAPAGKRYDRFRDRIMFPIESGRGGRIVSFGGRALDPQAKAKYLNGTDTQLFHKGQVLYGLPEARKLVHADPSGEAPLVAVEGYMDVIACQRAGVGAVATMGTALTEAQMEALWRLHPEPTLCFDGDRAGRAAAFRAIDRALPLLKAGQSFKFALALGGKDPDEVLREAGASTLKTRLADTVAFAELLFVRERDAEPLDTPERRAGLKQRLRRAAAAIADPDLKDAYREDLQRRFDALFPAATPGSGEGRGDGRAFRRGFRGPDPRLTDAGRAAARRLAHEIEPLAAALASYALADPPVMEAHLDELGAAGLGDPGLADLVNEIIRLRLEADHLDTGALERHLRTRGFSALLNDIDRAASKSGAPFIQSDVTLAVARSQWSHAFSAMCRLAALNEAVSQAASAVGTGSSADSTHRALKTERDSLRRALKSGTIWGEDGSI